MYVVKHTKQRYELVETLAEGSMGIVELARDTSRNRLVAIKRLRDGATASREEQDHLRECLLREASIAESLDHANIVDVYEVIGADGPKPALVMEYVAGSSLADLLKSNSPLPIDLTLMILTQLSLALEHAHAKGVIHGDIKAANVLITDDEQAIKLADFGIAQGPRSASKQPEKLFGTPRYVAPELLMGRAATPQSDLYSVGVLLFEMLIGRSPYKGSSAADVSQEVLQGSLDIGAEELENIPEDLGSVLRSLLARDPDDRYPSVRSLLEDLGHRPSPVSVSDETLATQELTQLVVPELPEVDDIVGDPAPPNLSQESETPSGQTPASASYRAATSPSPWRRYIAIGLVAAVLTVAASWLGFVIAKPEDRSGFETSDQHRLRLEYVPLLKEGHRLLRDGEPAIAVRLFQRALDIAPNDPSIAHLVNTAEIEALSQREHSQIQHLVQEHTERAKQALAQGQPRKASQIATNALLLDPENLEAAETLRLARSKGSRTPPKPRHIEPEIESQELPETVQRADIQFPDEPVKRYSEPSARDSSTVRNERLNAGTSRLRIDVFSYLPKGVVTIYAEENQILLEPFRFVRKAGLVRRKKSAGRLERTVVLPSGSSELRIYVSAEGFETHSVTVSGTLTSGSEHVLRLIIADNGTASAQLN